MECGCPTRGSSECAVRAPRPHQSDGSPQTRSTRPALVFSSCLNAKERFEVVASEAVLRRLPMKSVIPVGFVVCSIVSGAIASAADWNQWRGPGRDGIVTGFKAPAAWSADALAKKWSVSVGEGHSSPVVAGDRVYVFAREGDQEIMRCVALGDGRVIWKAAYAAPYAMNPAARGHGKGPKSTPTVAHGRVFALGINGHLSAYDAGSGAVLWRKSFADEFKSTSPAFGAAASPIVDGDNVIVRGWEGRRRADNLRRREWQGELEMGRRWPGLRLPVIATIGGVRQLIRAIAKRCLSVSPVDGKLLWEIRSPRPTIRTRPRRSWRVTS